MSVDLLLVSTCGTSTLTNRVSDETRKWLNRIANETELPQDQQEQLEAHVAERRAAVLGADLAGRRRASAELNGIAAVLAQYQPQSVFHLLIHTDTLVGRASAGIVREALLGDGHGVDEITAGGLRTNDLPAFREALADLTRQLEERCQGYRRVLFNLTGGFKSVNAYLQAIGMLYADRCVFLFEGADALMEIPRIPVRLAELDEVRTHLTIFRRLPLGYPVTEAEAEGIPEALILAQDGRVATSVWGDVVWARVQKRLLAERLLSPLSPKLRLARSIEGSFEGLEDAQRCEVNEALDALSASLDHERPLPKSRTFKPLRGDPHPPSTHELYAWSTGSAGRLLGHYEDGYFVVDALRRHL